MTNTSRYYHTCAGCGRTYGRGKGFAGLARHDCDEIRPALARLFRAGVERAKLAAGFSRTPEQIDALFRNLLP